MGLSAVVFKNIGRLEKIYGPGVFVRDESTGEAIPKSGAVSKFSLNDAAAISQSLGNIAAIALLREEASKTFREEKTIIVDQILYSGSHSGDSIQSADFPRVKSELVRLKRGASAEMRAFIQGIESLLKTAEEEGNPIVFV